MASSCEFPPAEAGGYRNIAANAASLYPRRLMDILLNQQHELRAGWKLLGYSLLFIIILLAVSLAVPISGPTTQLERLILNTIPTIPAVTALFLMAHFVDRAPIAKFGVAVYENWPRDWTLGIAIAAGMLVVVTVVSGTFGGITMMWTASDAASRSLLVTPLVLILSAAQEELVFRGYPLQVLMKGLGEWPAVWVMSIAFGLVHLLNPNATMIGALNTMLAGLMLSMAYLKTRSLWLPYGLHLGWNVGLGFVLGYPLSGIKIDSLWTTLAGGPKWLVGAEYGPEGGLAGTIVFLAAAIFIRKTGLAEVSPKIRAILSEN
jgi:membrane protease YdiL (CAAX protease family)